MAIESIFMKSAYFTFFIKIFDKFPYILSIFKFVFLSITNLRIFKGMLVFTMIIPINKIAPVMTAIFFILKFITKFKRNTSFTYFWIKFESVIYGDGTYGCHKIHSHLRTHFYHFYFIEN